MELNEIKKLLEENYELEVYAVEKIKNVYKVSSKSGSYCFKILPYEYRHFLFILSAIKHLHANNFTNTPEIIKNKCNEDFIEIKGKFAYLTIWLKARECNYDNPVDLKLAVSKLAELHLKSQGFQITSEMIPRNYWFKWFDNFETRGKEILDFKGIINQKQEKTYFDILYESILEEELERVDDSIETLKASDYLYVMETEVEKRGFCHHDMAHHNVLITEENTANIIDFDYCILDTHLHDLASIMIRRLKNGKWDIGEALIILQCYNEVYSLKSNELSIIASFIEFPQEYWQLGIQYYWERKPWEEEFFVNKLLKYTEDRDFRQDFIKELIEYRFKGGAN